MENARQADTDWQALLWIWWASVFSREHLSCKCFQGSKDITFYMCNAQKVEAAKGFYRYLRKLTNMLLVTEPHFNYFILISFCFVKVSL